MNESATTPWTQRLGVIGKQHLGLPPLLLWATASLFLAMPTQGMAQDRRRFVTGELKRVVCKVTKGQKAKEAFLSVLVKNRGRVSVEPLVFEVSTTAKSSGGRLPRKSWEIVRVGAPSFGRAGRGIRPGRKRVYLLQRPWTDRKDLQFKARVVRASFFHGKPILKAPVRVGQTRELRVPNGQGGSAMVTQVEVQNDLAHTVDVILRVRWVQGGAENLVVERLFPNEKRWIGQGVEDSRKRTRRPPAGAIPLSGHWKSIKVQDWSVVVDRGEAAAKKAFEHFWTRRARWPRGDLRVLGDLHYSVKRPGRASVQGSTRFELFRGTGQSQRISAKTGASADVAALLSQALAEGFAHLNQPDFPTMAKVFRFETVRLTPRYTLELIQRDPTISTSHQAFRLYELEEGRVVAGQGGTRASAFARFRLESVALPDERVVPKLIHRFTRIQGKDIPTLDLELQHGVTQGYPHPSDLRIRSYAYGRGTLESDISLRLSKLRFEGTIKPPQPPRGSAVQALRSAWNRPYRYPDEGLDLQGLFRLEAEASSANWEGHTELEGRFEFDQWSGRGGDSKPVFEALRIRFAPKPRLADAQALEALMAARYSIWARQDFSGRRAFATVFADAVLEPDPENRARILVSAGPFQSVTLSKGLVHTLEFRDGRKRELEFSVVHGQLVAARVVNRHKDRKSILSATFSVPKRGQLFPQKIDVRGWFNEDWHEVYHFSRAKRRAPR